jgi:23S rRNA (cytosine1962-C5)-methyltransferase
VPSIKFQQALATRQPLLDGKTDTCRLIDGTGDDYPDLFLETFANRLLLSTRHDHLLNSNLRDDLAATGQSVYWKHLDQNQKTSPEHLCGPAVDEAFEIHENGARYLIDFAAGYSQGLFLDQRDNRKTVRGLVSSGDTVLNTFAYTGAFSVIAALGGATTTTLDLSQPYLDWAKENFRRNHLDPGEHYFCKGDTFHWLRRFAKQSRRFHGIVLDPPTFSRDKEGKVFAVEKDYHQLFALAVACLEPAGWILASTNCRKLHPAQLRKQLQAAVPSSHQLAAAPMPPDFTGEPYLKSMWMTPR